MGLFFKIGSYFMIKSMEKTQIKDYQKEDETYTLEKDIPYLNDGNIKHTFNIYRYQGKNKKKGTLIHIHGGCWIYGDKMYGDPYYVYLTHQGYDVVSISYQLIPKVEFYYQVQDCYYALKYLFKNQDNLNLDLSKVMLIGDSAGGLLALLTYGLITKSKLNEVYKLPPLNVKIDMLTLLHPCLEIHRSLGLLSNKDNYYLDRIIEKEFFKGYKDNPIYYYSSLSEVINYLNFNKVHIVTSLRDNLNKHAFYAYDLFLKHHVDVTIDIVPFYKKLDHVFELLHPEFEESILTNNLYLDIFEKINK